MRMLTLLLVDEILLPRYVNWFTYFIGLPLNVKIAQLAGAVEHTNCTFAEG